MATKNLITIPISFLTDDRIGVPDRILLALSQFPPKGGSAKDPKEIGKLIGADHREVSRSLRRLMERRLVTPEGDLDLQQPKEETTSKLMDIKRGTLAYYPELRIWNPVHDDLFAAPLDYLRDLSDPRAIDFWRFWWRSVKAIRDRDAVAALKGCEGTIRDHIVLMIVNALVVKNRETVKGWKRPGQQLQDLIAGITKADLPDIPKIASMLREKMKTPAPNIRAEIAKMTPAA